MGQGNLIVALEEAEGAETKPRRGTAPASDLALSAHYACTHCGLSFEPPTPQLFSFNSPQGMCTTCDGLGDRYSFDPELLVPDSSLSFKEGAFVLLGGWRDMGRWRRHIYQGVADTIEHKRSLTKGIMLDTPWRELDAELQKLWLWGTGDEHITFTCAKADAAGNTAASSRGSSRSCSTGIAP